MLSVTLRVDPGTFLRDPGISAGPLQVLKPCLLSLHTLSYVYRWLKLIQDRPKMTNLETWYKLLVKRPAFKCNVLDIPFK